MLEHSSYLVQPFTAPEASSGQRCQPGPSWLIRASATGQLLGLARWRPHSAGLRGWLMGRTLEVCETDDEPLVFTIHRLWSLFGRWEVRDADGNRVGTLRGCWVLDRFGNPLAAREDVPHRAGRFRGLEGSDLATLEWTADGIRIHFAEDQHINPFVKMLLMAGLLVASRR